MTTNLFGCKIFAEFKIHSNICEGCDNLPVFIGEFAKSFSSLTVDCPTPCRYCKFCDVKLNSAEQAGDHIVGSRHYYKVKDVCPDGVVTAIESICGCGFRSSNPIWFSKHAIYCANYDSASLPNYCDICRFEYDHDKDHYRSKVHESAVNQILEDHYSDFKPVTIRSIASLKIISFKNDMCRTQQNDECKDH